MKTSGLLPPSLFCLAVMRIGAAGDAPGAARPEKPNILFILVDDLRPQFGIYGHPETLAPAMDRLASRGMVFDQAYCGSSIGLFLTAWLNRRKIPTWRLVPKSRLW